MAERGRETLRHGPMKPVGLTDPRNPTVKPHAVVQLRQDNALGTLFNMVGFQTKLRHGEQTACLPDDSGAREGGVRAARRACTATPISTRRNSSMRDCGSGRCRACVSPARSPAARVMSRARRSAFSPGASRRRERLGSVLAPPPATTAIGALLAHITGGHLLERRGGGRRASRHRGAGNGEMMSGVGKARSFQPMNVNFGLFLAHGRTLSAGRAANACAALPRRKRENAP